MLLWALTFGVTAALVALASRSRLASALIAGVCLSAWPLYFEGLFRGWWGHGVGEGWEYGRAYGTLAAAIGCVAGLVVGRLRRARFGAPDSGTRRPRQR